MAKEYKVGDRLYLPVWVTDMETNVMAGRDKSTVITDAKFAYTYCLGRINTAAVRYGEEGLLLTAEDIAMVINTERDDALAELKARNAELEALLKEVMATRDEAIRQNDELITKNNELEDANCNLTKACSEWQIAAQTSADNAKVADAAADQLRKENRELKAKVTGLSVENDKVKAWYDEANKTASEAAEANDELKAKISDLRNRVGEKLAQIQDLNAEVHFHKEFGEGLDKQQKELQARYDELDSVNHEQAEKIRKLDKALTDLKQQNDKLQDENTNLSFLLEAQPEEESTKTLHVVLNDGTEIEFRRYTSYDYRTDINMFVVKDGEKYIAGFLRGDKPTNIAYWWTE